MAFFIRSDSGLFELYTRIYLIALLVAAGASVGIAHYGRKVTKAADERIAQANAVANTAILEQEKLRSQNLRLQKEVNDQAKTLEQHRRRIGGDNVIDH